MIFCFAAYELDTAAMELRHDGAPIHVEPQVFAVIALLLEQRGRMVSRDELIDHVWGGRFISEAALSSRIRDARRAIGDDGKAQTMIRTVHGRGFRFVGSVTIKPALGAALAEAPMGHAIRATGAKPSIAILPFQPLSQTIDCEVMAQALSHDLITGLSRLSWLKVIARGSTFHFPSRQQQPSVAARLLGARYEMSGAVLRAARLLTVMVELIDTDSETIIWADTLHGRIDDVHRLRHDIARRVCQATEFSVTAFEADQARVQSPQTLDAWQTFHLGLSHMYRFSAADNERAAALFRRAIALEPAFARAHAGLSFCCFQNAFMRYPGIALPTEIMGARQSAERALELDDKDPFAHFTMGRSFWLDGNLAASLSWLDRATRLNPNFAQGQYAAGWARTLLGDLDAGAQAIDQAIDLSPMDPLLYGMLATRAFVAMQREDYAGAANWAAQAAQAPRAHGLISLILVAAGSLAGDDVTAQASARQARLRQPHIDRQHFFTAFPFADRPVRGRIEAALARFGF